jgi:hypothetical protein
MPIYPKRWGPGNTGGTPYNIDSLKRHILKTIKLFDLKDIETEPESGMYEVMVDEIAPGSQGVNQIYNATEFFGADIDPEADEAWDELEDHAEKIAGILRRETGLSGGFKFGHSEGGGDYGLFYVFDNEDHPELFESDA